MALLEVNGDLVGEGVSEPVDEVGTETNVESELGADFESYYHSDSDTEVDIDDREMPANYGHVQEIDDNYSSEDLDSIYDSDSDIEGTQRRVKFNPNDMCAKFKFKPGLQFCSLQQFKDVILEYHVLIGRTIIFLKNDLKRVRVRCKQKCGYEVLCSKVANSYTFEVKTVKKPAHTCGRIFNNKNAKAKWVAGKIVDKLKSNPKLTLTAIVDEMRIKYATGIKMCTVEKARNLARAVIEGDSSKQYSLLWSYIAELRRVSTGNTCKLQLDRPGPELLPRFQRYYMCLDGCKKAFSTTCRPFVGVDGCHLKNKYGGILLVAVGRDPNDQYLPLAFAVVEAENKDSWRWFMTLLLEDLGDENRNRFVFISDQQKGLLPTFDDLLARSEQRFCLRHLYSNFKKKFGGGTLIRDIMMRAAKATYHQTFTDKMNQLKELNVEAHNWLAAIPTKYWCKHAFTYFAKCDALMNNLTESFNATILLAREKPILTLMEWIRTYLMNRFASLNENAANYACPIMPKPMKRLNREKLYSGNWFSTLAEELKFEVTHSLFTKRFIVDLPNRTCSCNFWQLVGIPCQHAVSAINSQTKEPVDYVHKYYHLDIYKLCYSHMISPMNDQKLWPRTTEPEILPPLYKRGAGRPRKLRRREPDEPANPTKLRKCNTKVRCKRCNELGHNIRTCKVPPPEPQAEPETEVEGQQPELETEVEGPEPEPETEVEGPQPETEIDTIINESQTRGNHEQLPAPPILATQESQTNPHIVLDGTSKKNSAPKNSKRKVASTTLPTPTAKKKLDPSSKKSDPITKKSDLAPSSYSTCSNPNIAKKIKEAIESSSKTSQAEMELELALSKIDEVLAEVRRNLKDSSTAP